MTKSHELCITIAKKIKKLKRLTGMSNSACWIEMTEQEGQLSILLESGGTSIKVRTCEEGGGEELELGWGCGSVSEFWVPILVEIDRVLDEEIKEYSNMGVQLGVVIGGKTYSVVKIKDGK